MRRATALLTSLTLTIGLAALGVNDQPPAAGYRSALTAFPAPGGEEAPLDLRVLGRVAPNRTTPAAPTTTAPTTTTVQPESEPEPEPTTTTTAVLVPGSPEDPWGPVRCERLAHPAHHQPCPAAAPVTTAPAVTRAPAAAPAETGTGACGGSLPPCWVLQAESRGNIRAVNAAGCGGRGCFGKWQFDPRTSQGLGYALTMDQYPESVQDEAARTLWAGGAGCRAWGAC